jgi:GAF domain-containing protein
MLGRPVWEALSPPALRRRHRLRLRQMLATSVSRDGWSVEDVGLRADGESFPLDIRATPTWVKGRRFFTCVVRDIGTRKAARDAAALEHAIGQLLARGLSERDTLEGTLVELCADGWDVAHYWTLDAEAGLLRCSLTSHGAGGPFTHLDSASREEALPRGTDLPGRAWLAGAPIWVDDVRRDASFARQAAAARGGLRSAVAFPARIGPRIVGVVECLSRDRRTPPPYMEARLSALGRQIAQFVEASRATLALRRRAGMLEAVAGGAELLLRGAAWKDCVDAFLSGIGEAAGASRAFFCESVHHPEPGDSRCQFRHEWVAPGALLRPALSADYPLGVRGLPGWIDVLRGGDVVTSRVGRAEAGLREVLGAQAVRSTLMVPVHQGFIWRGVLGLEDAWLDREWTEAERGALLAAARLLGTALAGAGRPTV